MNFLLCRNRVADFQTWWNIFSSHKETHRAAGLHLLNLWPSLEDENNIFFLFEVSNLEKAKAFINAPEAPETSKRAGVKDGEYRFLGSSMNY